jgi:hypothetical protein
MLGLLGYRPGRWGFSQIKHWPVARSFARPCLPGDQVQPGFFMLVFFDFDAVVTTRK